VHKDLPAVIPNFISEMSGQHLGLKNIYI